MKREINVHVRLTESEYQKLIEMMQKSGGYKNLSNFIREKLFAEMQEKNDYREVAILIRQLRSEISHALNLFQKDFLTDAAMEMKKSNDMLEKIQKEMIENGDYKSGSHEAIQRE